MHDKPKMSIETAAGRHLGVYPGANAVEAADEYARRSGYKDCEDAETHKFLAMERLVFTPAS